MNEYYYGHDANDCDPYDVNNDGCECENGTYFPHPIFMATTLSHIECLKKHIITYSSFNFNRIYQRYIKKSLASLAIMDNNIDILKILINCGLDLKIENLLTRTYMHDALIMKEISFEMVYFLIENKCDINGKGEYEETPLISLIRNIHCQQGTAIQVIDILMRNGCDINKVDKYNNSALGHALHRDKYLIIPQLIFYGAHTDSLHEEIAKQRNINVININILQKKMHIMDILSHEKDGQVILPFPTSGGHLALFGMIVDYMFCSFFF
jgi:hypothetical protein